MVIGHETEHSFNVRGTAHKIQVAFIPKTLKMLRNVCHQNLPSNSRDMKLKGSNFREENDNMVLLSVSIKMENNRIGVITVNHIKMKKETICHISVIWDIDIMKLFTKSVGHNGNTITRFSGL